MNDEAFALAIELGRAAITLIQTYATDWQDVYIRFNADEFSSGWKGSYTTPSGVEMIDVMKLKNEGRHVCEIGLSLRDAIEKDGKKFVVCLIRANNTFDFQIDYEWKDPAKWQINKFNGATGLPVGLELLPPLC